MDRYKLRVGRSRVSGFPYKRDTPRDTPLKPAQRRREGRKLTSSCRKGNRILLPRKHCYTLREEPEEEDNMNDSSINPASLDSVKPVSNGKSVLLSCNHAFTKTQTALHATPAKEETSHEKVSQAGYPTIQKTPALQDSKEGDSPQSASSCSMEPDTTSSSEEEDEDYGSGNYFSSGSATLSSIPSPEIFRKENVKSNSSGKEESSLYLHNKNSTLLDVSHAKSIQMQQPPNLSAIIDTSTIHVEKNCVTRQPQKPEPGGDTQADPCKSASCTQDLQRKTPPKLTVRKLILCKKVWFKSPTTAEILEAKPIPSLTSELSSLPEQVKPDPDPSKISEISCKEETLPLKVKLKRPVKTDQVTAKFFDFGSDSERDAYFKWMRERCDKLKNPVLFPFMMGTQEPSIL